MRTAWPSVTQTLGGPFGSRATGLGFFLGRMPTKAEALPAKPDSTAQADSTVGEAQLAKPFDPWEEPPSWAVPTILVRDGVPGLVLGSPGGPRAVSAVVQVITAWVDAGLPIAKAVAAPRMHAERDTVPRPKIAVEGVIWIDPSTQSALAPWGASFRQVAGQRGLRLAEAVSGLEYLGLSPWFGGVNAVARENKEWVGGADPRRDGEAHTLADEDLLRAQTDADLPQEETESGPPLPPARPPSAGR